MSKKKLSDDAKAKRLRDFSFKEIEVSAEERGKFCQEVAFLFSAKQKVIFSSDAFWTARGSSLLEPQLSLDILRFIRDDEIGIGPDVLEEIIEKHIPIVGNAGSTLTTKRIIDIDYIRRVGGHSSMLVLIKVSFSGLISEECYKLEGLYVLKLDPRNDGYMVQTERFNGKKLIYEGAYVFDEFKKQNIDKK